MPSKGHTRAPPSHMIKQAVTNCAQQKNCYWLVAKMAVPELCELCMADNRGPALIPIIAPALRPCNWLSYLWVHSVSLIELMDLSILGLRNKVGKSGK